MTTTASEIIKGTVLLTTPTVLFTCPVLTQCTISQFIAFNSDGVPHLIQLWISNGVTTGLNDAVGQFILDTEQSLSVWQMIRLVVPPGGSILAQADTAGVVNIKASANLTT